MIGLVCLSLLIPDGRPIVTWNDSSSPNVVKLAACVRVSSGPLGGPTASAICVGEADGFSYLLTAAHAVPKWEPRVYEFFSSESPTKPVKSLTQGEVVVRAPESDFALVKLPTPDFKPAALRIAARGERPKEFPFTAIVFGCPKGEPPQAMLTRVIAKAFVRRLDGSATFFWQLDAPPIGGMSGGALLNANGKLVGICSAAQDQRGYFTHHDEVLYALKRNGFGWLFEAGQ